MSRSFYFSVIVAIGLCAQGATGRNQAAAPLTGWDRIFDIARDDPSLRTYLLMTVEAAEVILKRSPANWVRPLSLSQLPLSQRPANLEQLGGNAEAHALARADCDQAQFLQKEGLILALAARYTGRQEFLDRCLEILEATSRHVPLQRPGYTLKTATDRLPPGGDGVWLATAWGINGVARITEVLGDRVPLRLQTELRKLVRTELDRIVQDWDEQRPWFVKVRAVTSNQWVEPSVALVQGAVMLGNDETIRHYELGIANLRQTLAALGADGAWPEGMGYAEQSAGRLLHAVSMARGRGDCRLDGFEYIQNAWSWFLHMRMPGGFLANFADTALSVVPPWFRDTPSPSMFFAAMAARDSRVLRITKSFYPHGSSDPHGLEYFAATRDISPLPKTALPTFAYFPSQALVCWRSSWEDVSGMGLWAKGGTRAELHGHRDQGGFCVYSGRQPVLIDCGRSDYGASDYRRTADRQGHSVLQPGAIEDLSRPCDAPMEISHLGPEGGALRISPGGCYAPGTEWCRSLAWNGEGQVVVEDKVSLPGTFHGEWMRFHTGSCQPLEVTGSEHSWTVSWTDATMTLTADCSIVLSQEEWPDYLGDRSRHYVVKVDTASPATKMQLKTVVVIKKPAGLRE